MMDANVTQSWLMARAAGKQMLKQGKGGKVDPDVVGARAARPSRPATPPIAPRSRRSTASPRRSAANGATPASPSMRIAPTVFRSPLTAWMYEDTERAKSVRKGFLARVPKGRLGEPSDLAGPLLFLASKASDFYTGHILYADGGYTAG